METTHERHVVVPDLHGYTVFLEQIIDYYPDDVGIVSLGDIVDSRDRRGTRQTLELFHELGNRATIIKGNHEWVLWGAMHARDEYRDDWINYWSGIESNVLNSYDIVPAIKTRESADALAAAMMQAGHYALLENAKLYFETDEFIAVHAGLSPLSSWENQRQFLDEAHIASLNGNMVIDNVPDQIMSFGLAQELPELEWGPKTLISGHDHKAKSPDEALVKNGKRVLLATEVHGSHAPLYVWESWTQDITVFNKTPSAEFLRSRYRKQQT